MARVEDAVEIQSTSTQVWESASLDPRNLRKGSDYKNLAALLRICNTKHRDERIGYFWSSELLSLIMTRERVNEAVIHECRGLKPNRKGLQALVDTIMKASN
jgi:hypothetical protein